MEDTEVSVRYSIKVVDLISSLDCASEQYERARARNISLADRSIFSYSPQRTFSLSVNGGLTSIVFICFGPKGRC